MPSRFGYLCAPLLAVSGVGCGSRSALLLDEGTPSTGGISSGGTSSGGTSSGGASSGGTSTGGSATGGTASTSPCHGLAIASPVLTPKKGNGPLDDGLRLTPTSDDGLRITAAWIRKTGQQLHVRHATLRPWESWPANGELGPVENAGIETESNIAVGRGAGQSWAAALRAPSGPRLLRSIDAFDGGQLAPPVDLPGIEPMFVSRDLAGTSHLVGTFDVTSPGQLLRGIIVGSDGKATEIEPLGCANGQPPRADAAPFADHWLVVASRSASSSCELGAGSPTDLSVLDVPKEGPASPLAVFLNGPTIIDVGAAPHPQGVYAVWTSAINGTTQISALHVDATVKVITGPVVVEPNAQNNGVTIGAVGDQLVIARKSGPGAILVSVYEPTLTLAAETLLATNAPNPMLTAVQGSASGEGLLLGWAEQAMNDFTVHLARIDCAP